MTLTSVNDYILALPNHFNGLTFVEVEHFLTVLMAPENNFPREAIRLEFNRDPEYMENDEGEIEQVNLSVEDFTQFAMDPENMTSFGLRFMMTVRDQIMLGGGRIVDDIVRAIVNINKKTITQADIVTSSIEQSADENSLADQEHQLELRTKELQRKLDDLKERICIKYLTEEEQEEIEAAEKLEQCYIKVRNYREDGSFQPPEPQVSPTKI